jgi:polysaccharide biosynthesis/export protein VpsN
MPPTRAFRSAGLATLLTVAMALGAQQPAPGLLRSGDVLRIVVWRNPELSGDMTVGEDGTLQHPMYRNVRVAGLARGEVLELVRATLQRFEVNPEFVLEPLYRVSVIGEVRTPNLYSVQPGVTVAQAVAMAGGRTDRSRPRAVLTRDSRRTEVDLDRPQEGSAALVVQSGDQIMVPRMRTSLTTAVSVASGVLAAVTSILLIGRSR